jgi:hypothetical protein
LYAVIGDVVVIIEYSDGNYAETLVSRLSKGFIEEKL